MLSRKVKTFVIVLLILLPLSYVAAFWIAVNSQAYKTSLDFLNRHEFVKGKIGIIQKSRLAFWGNSIEYRQNRWSAGFKIFLTGNMNGCSVDIQLEKNHSDWQVIGAVLSIDTGEIYDLMTSSR